MAVVPIAIAGGDDDDDESGGKDEGKDEGEDVGETKTARRKIRLQQTRSIQARLE